MTASEERSLADAPLRIVIGIATCRRPESLARLLHSLVGLRFTRVQPALRIVVVDNDAAGSSREVCAAYAKTSPWPTEYLVEPRRGIPFARNAIVSFALTDADAIAFVDDDETVEPGWLDALLDTQVRFSADIVAGPAVPVFASREPPQWAVKGPFFQLPRFPTGTSRDLAYTNNVLVTGDVFRDLPGGFDERLRFTGGSDTHFFRRASLSGHRIVWCDGAIVYDHIPDDRLTVRWVMQRAYRYGHTHAFVRVDLGQSSRWALVGAIGGRLWEATTSALVGLARRQSWRVLEAMTETAYAAGMSANLFGAEYHEYRPVARAPRGGPGR